MQTSPADAAIKSVSQGGHRVNVGANDEGLDHLAGFAVIARGRDTVRDNHNGRAV
jgi:hypothetical protein